VFTQKGGRDERLKGSALILSLGGYVNVSTYSLRISIARIFYFLSSVSFYSRVNTVIIRFQSRRLYKSAIKIF
jgi:hypothetical protein